MHLTHHFQPWHFPNYHFFTATFFLVKINYSQSFIMNYNRIALFFCPGILLHPCIESSVTWLDWDEAFCIESLFCTHTSLSVCLSVVCSCSLFLCHCTPHDVSTSVENGFVGSGVYCFRTFAVWTTPIYIHMPRSLNPFYDS